MPPPRAALHNPWSTARSARPRRCTARPRHAYRAAQQRDDPAASPEQASEPPRDRTNEQVVPRIQRQQGCRKDPVRFAEQGDGQGKGGQGKFRRAQGNGRMGAGKAEVRAAPPSGGAHGDRSRWRQILTSCCSRTGSRNSSGYRIDEECRCVPSALLQDCAQCVWPWNARAASARMEPGAAYDRIRGPIPAGATA